MKILFICRANVGRSQMAEALFNNLSKDHAASSAGLNPPKNWEGIYLSKTQFVTPCLAEIGLDVANQYSKKLTESMALEADKIVVIGEKERWPDYLRNSTKVIYWNVPDPDLGEMALYRTVRDQIKYLVESLINAIDSQR